MIVIDHVPSPAEVFKVESGELPDSWSGLQRAGGLFGGKDHVTMLQLLSPKCCFLYPSQTWHRLNLKVRSEDARPGEGSDPFVRFLGVDLVSALQTTSGQMLSVELQDWWRSPDDYQQQFPDRVSGPSEHEHRAFTEAFLTGRQP